jgi:hypothetical protein
MYFDIYFFVVYTGIIQSWPFVAKISGFFKINIAKNKKKLSALIFLLFSLMKNF